MTSFRIFGCMALFFLVCSIGEARTVFNVDSYGAVPDDGLDDGPAVRAAVAAAIGSGSPSEVRFGVGEYRLAPATGATECVKIDSATDLWFSGAGTNLTDLVFTDRSVFSIRVHYSQDVVVEGFSVDYDPLPFTQGTVTRVGVDEFDIQLDGGYPLLSDPYFNNPDWDILGEEVATIGGTNYYDGYLYHPDWAGPHPVFTDLGGGKFTVSPIEGERVNEMAQNDRMVLWANAWHPIEFIGNVGITFRNVNVFSSPWITTSWHANENVQIDHIAILPKPGTTRYLSTNRDGMTGNGWRGSLVIEDCYFQALGDDYINIGGYESSISSVEAAAQIVVSAPNQHETFKVGDHIQIYDKANATLVAQVGIGSVADLGSWNFRLILDSTVAGMTAGMKVYNIDSCGAGAVIRNNRFMESRSRVVLRSHDVLVESNAFHSVAKELIDIIYDYGWGAGIVPFNITVRGNEFIRPLGIRDDTLHVEQKTGGVAVPDMSITNILIEGNVFKTALVEPINLYGCRDVRIIDNTIEMTSSTGHDVIYAHYFEDLSIEDLELNDSGNLLRVFQGKGSDDVLFLRLSGNASPLFDYTSDGTVTMAEWLFDEDAGWYAFNSALDVSGNSYCILRGDAWWTNGCWGNAVNLDGAGDYLAINTLQFNRSDYDEITVDTWIKTTDPADQILMDFDVSEYWSLALSGGKPVWSVATSPGAEQRLNGTTAINDGMWHHVAAVFDQGAMRLYVDGVLNSKKTVGDGTFGTGTTRYGFIGTGSEASSADGAQGPTDYFNGDVDETHIFLRALTEDQIQRLYSFGMDGDRDGLPNWWEDQYFGGQTNANPVVDTDGDGQDNGDEYVTGLDPTNAASYFSLDGFTAGPEAVFQWDVAAGRLYNVYWSSNLLDGFTLLQGDIPWTENVYTDATHSAEQAGFYKLGVYLQEPSPFTGIVFQDTFDGSGALGATWNSWQNSSSGANPGQSGGSYVFDHAGTDWAQAAVQATTTVDVASFDSVEFRFDIKDFGGSTVGVTVDGRTSFIAGEHDSSLDSLFDASLDGMVLQVRHGDINFGSSPRTWVEIRKTDNSLLGKTVVQSTNDFTLVMTLSTNSWALGVEDAGSWIAEGVDSGLHGYDTS
ncbi:MAG: LamG domain-containing protein, partial [Verrucomicrobiota bacterium]